MQDAILELCVDVFLLHIAHVETARAGAGEGFVPQIAALLILFVIAVATHCLNGQVAVVQIHLNVFLLAAGQVNSYFVAVVRLFDIGLHHVCTALTKGITSLTVHHTFQCSVIPERIEEIKIVGININHSSNPGVRVGAKNLKRPFRRAFRGP